MTSTESGIARLAESRRLLALYKAAPDSVGDDDLRRLRQKAREALDRLDDHPEFERAHASLDEVGLFVRQLRPLLCLLKVNGNDYAQDCPVDLGHIRLGLSVGVEIEESHCSICLMDMWECPHVPGELYDGVLASRIITKAKFFEVSVVERPDFPDARFTNYPVSRVEVEALLEEAVPVGARPLCGRCLAACPGVRGLEPT